MKSISPSSIDMYYTCPLMWWYNYIAKLAQPENPAFIIGTGYHLAVQMYHQNKDEEEIKEEIKKSILSKYPTEQEVAMVGTVMQAFRKYKSFPVQGEIVESEYNFKIDIDDIPLPVYGFVDRIDTDKIVEYKTTSADYKEVDTIQARMYCYAGWKKTGSLLPVYFSVINKNKINKNSYKPQVLPIEYSEEDMSKLEQEVKDFYKNIEKANFNANPGNHCYWCPYGPKGTNNCKLC